MSTAGLGLRALTAGYPGEPAIVRDVELDVAPGSRVALLGANGSGKTTLLRCLSGALVPSGGAVRLDGEDLRYGRAALTRHRRRVQLVLQDPDDQLFSADVARDVSFGPLNIGLDDNEVRRLVDLTLRGLGIEHLRHRPTHQLSYGERKRVAIAGAVAMQPDFLLLDEPTAGLDPAGASELFTVLDQLQHAGTTVLLSTHDVAMALDWADRVAVMDDGAVRQGDPLTLLADQALMARARLDIPWVIVLVDALTRRGLLEPGEAPRGPAELVEALERAPEHP